MRCQRCGQLGAMRDLIGKSTRRHTPSERDNRLEMKEAANRGDLPGLCLLNPTIQKERDDGTANGRHGNPFPFIFHHAHILQARALRFT